MPYEWVGSSGRAPRIAGAASQAAGDAPLALLHLWPHRSLPKKGFVLYFSVTFALVLLPLLSVLGTPVLWGLLPFVLGTLALTWMLLQKSYRDGEVLEELALWTDHVRLTRTDRKRPPREWAANPHWVTVQMHAQGGPVEGYLTLKGAGREVEIGAFLGREERETLYPLLRDLIARAAATAPMLE